MSELVIVCPHCRRMFEYIPEAAGRYMHCHGCHVDVPVPLTTITQGLQLEDEYIVDEKLGAGNTSDVFAVNSLRGPTRMRLKALTLMATRDKQATSTFFKAIAKASDAGAPEIPKVIEFGQAADVYYYIGTSYHEGRCLDQIINENGPMSENDAMVYAMQIVSVLQRLWYNHAFIHRNLRPGNILITPTGEIMFLDAGADKRLLVDAASGLGRLNTRGDLTAYTAPELLGDHVEVDPRADIFALGGILLYLLTGHSPEVDDRSAEQIGRLCSEAGLPPPSRRCIQFIRTTMADDPEMRPGNWEEALLMLRQATDSRTDADDTKPAHTSEVESPQIMPTADTDQDTSPKRNLLLPIICVILALILIGGVSGMIYFVSTNRSTTPEPSQPQLPPVTHNPPANPKPDKPVKRLDPGITGVYLVDSQTGKEVTELKKNAVIHLARIPKFVAIRVDATKGTQSVHFVWNDRDITDNTEPFSPTGESRGIYTPWDIKNGVNLFWASPWSRKGANGRKGMGRQVKLFVIGSRNGQSDAMGFWNFNGKTTHGFAPKKHLTRPRLTGSCLKTKIIGSDAYLQKDRMQLPAWYIRKISINVRSTKPGNMRLRFQTDRRRMGQDVKLQQAISGNNQWHEYTFELGDSFEEGEILKAFRIYPLKGPNVQGAEIEIGWIRSYSK